MLTAGDYIINVTVDKHGKLRVTAVNKWYNEGSDVRELRVAPDSAKRTLQKIVDKK